MHGIPENVEQVISPYLEPLYKSIEQGIKDYQNNPDKVFFCPRTRSSGINDLIIKNAFLELAPLDGIRIIPKHGSHYLIIRDKFILKFKKFDNKLRSSNIPTCQSIYFTSQRSHQLKLDLPEIPMTNILAGYQWDRENGTVSGIHITCPNGKLNRWQLELFPQQISIAEVVPIIPEGKRKHPVPRRGNKRAQNISRE